MSVYEFEYFKQEDEVLEFWKSSSIYIICQRPVLFFDQIFCEKENGEISMLIRQRGESNELSVRLSLYDDERNFGQGSECWIEWQFYEKEPQFRQPFKNAAGFKVLSDKEEFLSWFTPERLLFRYLNGKIKAEMEGDVNEFLTYWVHYIGQAQNQNIWDRLTGHEKLSRALTLEHPFIQGEFSPYELSLIFLKFDGFTEQTIVNPQGSDEIEDMNGNILADEEIVKAFTPQTLEDIRWFTINDFEAYLVNLLEPKYNKILFTNYPNIKNGLRALGFEIIDHQIRLFANLVTDRASLLNKISFVKKK
jgi:hypothetical protein